MKNKYVLFIDNNTYFGLFECVLKNYYKAKLEDNNIKEIQSHIGSNIAIVETDGTVVFHNMAIEKVTVNYKDKFIEVRIVDLDKLQENLISGIF